MWGTGTHSPCPLSQPVTFHLSPSLSPITLHTSLVTHHNQTMTTANASPTVETLRAFATKTLTTASELFVKDIEAITHEDLAKSWGVSSRTGYDIAYEVAIIN